MINYFQIIKFINSTLAHNHQIEHVFNNNYILMINACDLVAVRLLQKNEGFRWPYYWWSIWTWPYLFIIDHHHSDLGENIFTGRAWGLLAFSRTCQSDPPEEAVCPSCSTRWPELLQRLRWDLPFSVVGFYGVLLSENSIINYCSEMCYVNGSLFLHKRILIESIKLCF